MRKRDIEYDLLRVEVLTDRLNTLLKEQSEQLEKITDVVRFLSEHDKFGVVIEYDYTCPKAKYIHDMEPHTVDIPCSLFDAVFVKENNADSCLLHTSGSFDSYFKLDKHNHTIVDVTDIYRKGENKNGVQ